MKKYSLLILTFLLGSLNSHAQTVGSTALETAQLARQVERAIAAGKNFCIPWLGLVGDTGLYSFQLTHQLKHQSKEALATAREISKDFPNFDSFFFVPVLNVKALDVSRVRAIYPHLSSLTEKQLALALAKQENTLFAQEASRFKKYLQPRAQQLLPRFREEAKKTENVKDPIRFVVKQLSPDISTILLGEEHFFPHVQDAVARFLHALYMKYPKRKIIVLTEFLPENFVWGKNQPRSGLEAPGECVPYPKLWEIVTNHHMEIIGMEPLPIYPYIESRVLEFTTEIKPEQIGDLDEDALWEAAGFTGQLSGMKYRNEQFVKTIQAYREKYPDALLVVYAGSAHVGYNDPFALADALPKENKFVLKMEIKAQKPSDMAVHSLNERLEFEEDFAQKLLYFQDPELAHIAGFDANIIVE